MADGRFPTSSQLGARNSPRDWQLATNKHLPSTIYHLASTIYHLASNPLPPLLPLHHVHRSRRSRLRVQARRSPRVARLAHRRTPPARLDLADLPAHRDRARAHSPRGYEAHASRLLRLSVDALPGHVTCMVGCVRPALLRNPPLRTRGTHPRTRRVQSLGLRLHRAPARSAAL